MFKISNMHKLLSTQGVNTHELSQSLKTCLQGLGEILYLNSFILPSLGEYSECLSDFACTSLPLPLNWKPNIIVLGILFTDLKALKTAALLTLRAKKFCESGTFLDSDRSHLWEGNRPLKSSFPSWNNKAYSVAFSCSFNFPLDFCLSFTEC